jgi:hypothetical protein
MRVRSLGLTKKQMRGWRKGRVGRLENRQVYMVVIDVFLVRDNACE